MLRLELVQAFFAGNIGATLRLMTKALAGARHVGDLKYHFGSQGHSSDHWTVAPSPVVPAYELDLRPLRFGPDCDGLLKVIQLRPNRLVPVKRLISAQCPSSR